MSAASIPALHNGPSKKLSTFRNCFEASMTFEEAIGCAGLSDQSPSVIEMLRGYWMTLAYREILG